MTEKGKTPATDPDNILIVWDDDELAEMLSPSPRKTTPKKTRRTS